MSNTCRGLRHAVAKAGGILLLAFCLAPIAGGQTLPPRMVGQSVNVEKPDRLKFSPQSGLRLTFDASRLQSEVTGYTTLLIQVDSQTPLASDTRLRIDFSSSITTVRADLVVSQEWTLPAGTSRESLRLEIPSYGVGHLCWWDVWVDRAHDDGLSQKSEQPIILQMLMGTAPADVTPLRLLDTNYRDSKNPTWRDVLNATLAGGALPSKDLPLAENVLVNFVPGDLPDRWEDLLPMDIVRIRMDELVRTQQERPRAFEALLRWVHGGGTLWVDQVGDDWEKLSESSQVLGWNDRQPQSAPRIPGEEEPPGVGAWDAIDLDSPRVAYLDNGMVMGPDGAPITLEELREYDNSRRTQDSDEETLPFYSDKWMAVRQLGWGTVAAFRRDWSAGAPGLRKSHRDVAAQYFVHLSWFERHGTNPQLPNGDFSSWLVPGVGSAPVLEFEFLITLFVIVIGPLNYWLLKRVRRLHLLVVTIPLVATLVTVALLGYGLLADGWATKVRSLSVTYINQEHKIASSWSRNSYYAAFAPREGLEFSRHDQVYPISPGAYEAFANPSGAQSLRLKWTDEEQQLERGWLSSRTPTQFLVIESQQEAKGLKIGRHDQQLVAESPFAAPLEWVAAIDDQGEWYQAKDIRPEGRVTLEPATDAEVVSTFRRLVQDRQPSVPPEVLENPLPYRARRRHYGYWNQSSLRFETSLLAERWNLLNGQETYRALRLPHRSYIVVGDTALTTNLGLEDAVELGSVHVVLGDW